MILLFTVVKNLDMVLTRELFYKRKMTLKGKTVQEGWALGRKFGMPTYGRYGCMSCSANAGF